MAGLGERDAERSGNHLEELVGNLHEDAGAVAGERVGADGAAMGQVLQDLETLLDDFVARPGLQGGDEADTAGIVLSFWIV
jgi:hypothetical protein